MGSSLYYYPHSSNTFLWTIPNTIFAVVLCRKAVCWRELNVERSPFFLKNLPAVVRLGLNVLTYTEEPMVLLWANCQVWAGVQLLQRARFTVANKVKCTDLTRTANLHLKRYFLCRFVLVCRSALCIVIIFVSLWYVLKIVLRICHVLGVNMYHCKAKMTEESLF